MSSTSKIKSFVESFEKESEFGLEVSIDDLTKLQDLMLKLSSKLETKYEPCFSCKICASGYGEKGKYCQACFAFNHPETKEARWFLFRQNAVTDFLKIHFGSYLPIINRTVGGCSRRRPDFMIDLLTKVIIVEVDENQHRSYDSTCELSRIYELWEDLACRNICFIRFNPDAYTDKDGKRHPSCFIDRVTNKEELNIRLENLKETMIKYITKYITDSLEFHLYYNNHPNEEHPLPNLILPNRSSTLQIGFHNVTETRSRIMMVSFDILSFDNFFRRLFEIENSMMMPLSQFPKTFFVTSDDIYTNNKELIGFKDSLMYLRKISMIFKIEEEIVILPKDINIKFLSYDFDAFLGNGYYNNGLEIIAWNGTNFNPKEVISRLEDYPEIKFLLTQEGPMLTHLKENLKLVPFKCFDVRVQKKGEERIFIPTELLSSWTRIKFNTDYLTSRYRYSEDPIDFFINAELDLFSGTIITTSDLYKAYKSFCNSSVYTAIEYGSFIMEMSNRGFKQGFTPGWGSDMKVFFNVSMRIKKNWY